MCLVTKTNIPSIAKNDITCYKVLISMDNTLRTVYRDFPVSIGVVMTDTAKEEIKHIFGNVLIEGGFFHSCVDIESAKTLINTLSRFDPNSLKIYEAKIPKGTEYYKGECKDLCSKSLVIIKEYID